MNRLLTNLDAAESVFFLRELEHIKAKTYDKIYPELMARRLIPVSNEAGPGAEAITYRVFDSVGVAKLVADYATDLPKADAYGKEVTSPVRSLGVAYGYSLQEIRAARQANRPLTDKKASAARRAFEQALDDIAALGDEESGLKGLLNHPNVPVATLAAPWESKTPAEIVADISQQVGAIRDLTNGVESGPFTILLPDKQYTQIATTQNSSASDVTILEFVLKSNPWVAEIAPWWRCKGAGAGGSDRMVIYTRNPDKLTLEIPQDFEQLPVQEKSLYYEVPCHGRIGGVIWYYPLSARYVDGI